MFFLFAFFKCSGVMGGSG
jgi:Flp pilus assembly protein TadB